VDRQALVAALGDGERPYDPLRVRLYSTDELLSPLPADPRVSVDEAICRHYEEQGGSHPGLGESLCRRLHDFAIDEALIDAVGRVSAARTDIVGIMGGHSTSRKAPEYAQAARTGWLLRQAGYRVMTGGGPGLMEAGNLGAYIGSEWGQPELQQALELVAAGQDLPKRRDWRDHSDLVRQYEDYFERSQAVRARFVRKRPPSVPTEFANLAMPTWFYGWEPTNLFADAVAKYFSNSLREDGLLSVCVGGVVYCPGSLGTTQEVFVDAAQNHYETFGLTSPMAFLGRERWDVQTSHYRLVRELSLGRPWADYVGLFDDPAEAVAFIAARPPRRLAP
jgi:predicted Rossmann-fold nucleotide-binding protein